MPKLFVTGGAGFIGSSFVRLALAEIPSCEITNFDALTYAGNLDNLEGLDERHHFIRGISPIVRPCARRSTKG